MDDELGSLTLSALKGDVGMMQLKYLLGDRKAYAGSTLAGGKEWNKDLFSSRLVNALPVVADVYGDLPFRIQG